MHVCVYAWVGVLIVFTLMQIIVIWFLALSQLGTSKSHLLLFHCLISAVDLCRSVSHFMVVTDSEFLLVDPDRSKIGWGIVHFISFLQVG